MMSENQKKIYEIRKAISDNDDYSSEMYYQVMCRKCKNLDKYFEQFNLDNPLDRISVAQEWMNFDIVERELQRLNLSEYQKSKISILNQHNGSLFETLNMKILEPKYAFLDNILDFITTDIRTQQLLLSLDDNSLKLFAKMYGKLEKDTSNPIPYFSRILDLIGTSSLAHLKSLSSFDGKKMYSKKVQSFSELSHSLTNQTLTEHDLDILLYVFTNNNYEITISNITDLRNFEIEFQKFLDQSMLQYKTSKNLTQDDICNIKSNILLRSYGIPYDYALDLINKYNLDGIKAEEYNNYISMYMSILNIIKENDAERLLKIYDEIVTKTEFKLDFMTTTLFENGMRDIFVRHFNEETFKCDSNNFTIVDGVKIYDAGTDFKIILTSVGAYQPELEIQQNYFNYWNNAYIHSHGNCCSLIANNNLSTAEIRNICLGFSNFEDGMLLLSGSSDLNSTPTSRQINTQDHPSQFMSADNLIDNTRSDYNELVFERRDLSSERKYYKKNPDYIVMFEEFDEKPNIEKLDDNTQKLLLDEKRVNDISLKAAHDFNIPIVRINREKCAKFELDMILSMVNEFIETHNPILLERIIVEFENNRVGLRYPHDFIREKYFSKHRINDILQNIITKINLFDDQLLKTTCIDTLKQTIKSEYEKYNKAKNTRKLNYSQESGTDFDNIIKLLEISGIDRGSVNKK